ncbi:MAG TPA: hypothetical protein VFH08_17690 [Chitinophagaceae bacterium]|nr:hypothetical protein [Chitinophagaceae bacterium]
MKYLILIWFIMISRIAYAQDSLPTNPKLSLSGYIKDLQWVRFDKNFKHAYATNLVHNRLNLKWKPSNKINGRLEIRNRFYWGDDVKMIPGFKALLRNQNEAVDLSVLWLDNQSNLMHTNVERLWLEYRKTKWNLRAGRQRINWGITNTWNPNDLFNTYNFLDFDYEERPGSDAVKMQYMVNDRSHIEFAFAGTNDKPITAIKYFTNYKKYDLQAIAGLHQNFFTAGLGWAGSIGDAGFKGEAQYFAGKKDTASQLNITMEADYIFESGWYVSSAVLYHQNGLNGPVTDWTKVNFQAAPTQLMPGKWNILLITSREFTPRFNGTMSLVFSPGMNMLILFPSFKYNLTKDLDADLVWQSFFTELNTFGAVSHTGFFRLKYSF